MKKKLISAALAAIAVASLLSGCAAKSDRAMVETNSASVSYDSAQKFIDADYSAETEEVYYEATGSMADIIASAAKTAETSSEKMIYTASARVETLDFDGTVQAVYDMLEQYGAYIESSSVSGADYASIYRGRKAYREASFSIRVPVEHYSEMSSSLSEIGNVTSFSSNAQNITAQFTDTEARLKACRTEYDRLLEMMAEAETVEEMIAVEARLSEVEYNIESLTSTLRGWQDKVDYSTIELYVDEVHEYTEPAIEPESFWDRAKAAFVDSLEWLAEAAQDIGVFIVAAVPVLIIPAAVVVIIAVLLRRRRKKKTAQRKAEEEQAALRRSEWEKKNRGSGEE